MKRTNSNWFWGRRRPPKIFITYRRSGEGQGYGGRLADKLIGYFGPWQCFRDVENIETGVDFVESITRAVGVCEVLVVVIGPDWTTQKDKDGRPRLQNPNDFVRLEVAAALKRNIRVIPVLVGGAQVPTEDELPEDLKALSRRQAHEVTDTRWDYDVERLLEQIKSVGIRGRSPSERAALRYRAKVGAAVLSTALIVVLGMILWSNFSSPKPEDGLATVTPGDKGIQPEPEVVVKTKTDSAADKPTEETRLAQQRAKAERQTEEARLAEQRAKEAEQRALRAERRAEEARLAEQRAKQAEEARLAEQRAEQAARERLERKLQGVRGSILVGWWFAGTPITSRLTMDGANGTATVLYVHPQFGQMTAIHDLYFSDVSGPGFDYMLIGRNARPPSYIPDSFALAEAGGRVTVRYTCDQAGQCSELASVDGSFAHVH